MTVWCGIKFCCYLLHGWTADDLTVFLGEVVSEELCELLETLLDIAL